MTAKGILIALARIAEHGAEDLSEAQLIVYSDGSGHIKRDDAMLNGTFFNNSDELFDILEQMDKDKTK